MDERDYKAMDKKPIGYISGKPNKPLWLWGHEPINILLTLEVYKDLIEVLVDDIHEQAICTISYSFEKERLLNEYDLLNQIIDLYKESDVVSFPSCNSEAERLRFTANGCLIKDGVQII